MLNTTLAPPLAIRRFSVAQYHQLGELGILTPEENVELLEGWIVEKINQRPIHGYIVGLINETFQKILPSGWIVRCQLPVTTLRSEPEPDIAILNALHSDFRESHPNGSNCRLVIEVADTSLEKDRAKAAIYNESGVGEYWIVNIPEKRTEIYRFSESSTEPHSQLLNATDEVSLQVGDSTITISLRDLFA